MEQRVAVSRDVRSEKTLGGLSAGRRRYGGWLAAFAAVWMLFALAGPPLSRAAQPEATCFWLGPFDRSVLKNPELNFAYPDLNAAYWAARFNLPPGAHLELDGKFPRARYMSLNAYVSAQSVDDLTDVEIRPDRGSVNPFRPGHRRNLPNSRRNWSASVVSDPAPASGRAPNTLYAEPSGGVQELLYRIYKPDRGKNSRGNVRLPKPTVVLADGTRLTGSAACTAINDPVHQINLTTVPAAIYGALVHTAGADPKTVPAFSPVHWEKFFNFQLALSIYKRNTPHEADRDLISHEPNGGQYNNGDSSYIMTSINRAYGPLLVIRGKMPTYPRTDARKATRMRGGQVRYWSLCQNQTPVTTAVVSCLNDSQVPLTRKRQFTIVVSTKEDRPRSARRACGVAWLNWGHYVDTEGRKGTGFLILRNMLSNPSFRHSIDRIKTLGTERQVMGPYFPRARYMSRSQFRSPPCKAKKRPVRKQRGKTKGHGKRAHRTA